MKGVILVGGNGTRLMPLTNKIPKSLLPVYNKPMVFYPIETLIDSGITEILIVCKEENVELFKETISDNFPISITYTIRKPQGTADALLAAEEFIDGDSVTVLYGDNIFEESFKSEVTSFKDGAQVFIVEVSDPERYGVVEIKDGNIVGIEEKPKHPKSNYIDTGFMIFDNTIFDKLKKIELDQCGEYLMSDALKQYLNEEKLNGRYVETAWFDTGTFDSLIEAANFMKNNNK